MLTHIDPPDNWRDLKPSPLALKIPRPNKDDRGRIKSDIRANGFRSDHPILLYKGEIIDGATRHAVCVEIDDEGALRDPPAFQEWAPDQNDTPWTFVLRANVQRRQLTKSQIAALIVDGPEYEEAKAEGARAKSKGGRDGGTSAGRGRPKLDRDEEPGSSSLSEPTRAAQSRDKLGAELGVCGRLISDAERIKKHDEEHGTDMLRKVQAGEVPSTKKAKIALGLIDAKGQAKAEEPQAVAGPGFMESPAYACQSDRHTNIALKDSHPRGDRVILTPDFTVSADRLARYYDQNEVVQFIAAWSKFWPTPLLDAVIETLNRKRIAR